MESEISTSWERGLSLQSYRGSRQKPTHLVAFFCRSAASFAVRERGATHLRLSAATDFGWHALWRAIVLKCRDTTLFINPDSFPSTNFASAM